MAQRAQRREEKRLVTFWCPEALLPAIGMGARKTDLDKSKFIRSAIREKLIRHGVTIPSGDPTAA